MTFYKNRSNSWLFTLFISAILLTILSPNTYSFSVFEERFNALKKKATAGNVRAQYKMGVSYMRGTSNAFDAKKAASWFKKAAAKGYAKAWYRLGQMSYESKYGMRNYTTAFKWFSKAARKNHGVSQYYVALHYHMGRGVKKDDEYALIWATRAKKSGVPDAAKLIPKLKLLVKSSPPVKRITRNTGPKPRKGKRKRVVDVATPKSLDIRGVLTAGGWKQGTSPSNYVPSRNNKCVKVNTKIRCLSKRLKITRPTYVAHYRIVSLITNFKSKGDFTIKYRRNFLFILPDNPDDPNPNINMPNVGMEDKIAVLNCKMLAKAHIRCYRDDKTVVRFTKK